MRFVIIIVAVLGLNSCNTLIGVGRDTKLGYQWTKAKIQGAGDSGGASEEYGAPVY